MNRSTVGADDRGTPSARSFVQAIEAGGPR